MSDYQSRPSERIDELLQVLADRDRRAILSYLRESPAEQASIQELADVLSSRAPNDRSTALIRLHHCHLPTLGDAAVADYDAEARCIQYLGHPELEALLDSIDDCRATRRLFDE